MDTESRFVPGDLVTADGYGVGRVVKAEYTTARAINKTLARVRLAGEGNPRWFYLVRGGGGFDGTTWMREDTLRFADY